MNLRLRGSSKDGEEEEEKELIEAQNTIEFSLMNQSPDRSSELGLTEAQITSNF
jgi:hypothetical protein